MGSNLPPPSSAPVSLVRGLDFMPCPQVGNGRPTCPLTWPFDSARALYAQGVYAGVIRRSMVASGAFDRGVAALEGLALGPWARRV
ncbi:hypothetical protein RA210_U50238 [Rubrivivax sp. A210]|uniref:hypothetical protein n=1 Tax=Rubrivivax sp. A210 TaxID=2772301 RepID=UPI001919B2F8|nr:hypothetical protein [Rubrivivax sp. A210]CAD5374287.1 hypothetical protein RA210_U50238 [Rubrivivax sp. A210]